MDILELILQSPVPGSESAVYQWPLVVTNERDEVAEIIDTIRFVCEDRAELSEWLESALDADRDYTSYGGLKSLCDEYNRKVNEFIKLKSLEAQSDKHEGGRPSIPLLRHILQQCYNRAVIDPDKLNQYEPFSPEVYGETSFELIEQMINFIKFTKADYFIDLGSGVGQVVLQVAAASQCSFALGIEKAEWPAHYAVGMIEEFERWMRFYGKICGSYRIEKGNFLDEKYREKINGATVIFVNNFMFGPQVDHQLKLRFANMKEGARIVSSKTFCPLTFTITERNLGDIGAIMSVTELSPLRGPVSWTGKSVNYYLHTIDRSSLEAYFERQKLKESDPISFKSVKQVKLKRANKKKELNDSKENVHRKRSRSRKNSRLPAARILNFEAESRPKIAADRKPSPARERILPTRRSRKSARVIRDVESDETEEESDSGVTTEQIRERKVKRSTVKQNSEKKRTPSQVKVKSKMSSSVVDGLDFLHQQIVYITSREGYNTTEAFNDKMMNDCLKMFSFPPKISLLRRCLAGSESPMSDGTMMASSPGSHDVDMLSEGAAPTPPPLPHDYTPYQPGKQLNSIEEESLNDSIKKGGDFEPPALMTSAGLDEAFVGDLSQNESIEDLLNVALSDLSYHQKEDKEDYKNLSVISHICGRDFVTPPLPPLRRLQQNNEMVGDLNETATEYSVDEKDMALLESMEETALDLSHSKCSYDRLSLTNGEESCLNSTNRTRAGLPLVDGNQCLDSKLSVREYSYLNSSYEDRAESSLLDAEFKSANSSCRSLNSTSMERDDLLLNSTSRERDDLLLVKETTEQQSNGEPCHHDSMNKQRAGLSLVDKSCQSFNDTPIELQKLLDEMRAGYMQMMQMMSSQSYADQIRAQIQREQQRQCSLILKETELKNQISSLEHDEALYMKMIMARFTGQSCTPGPNPSERIPFSHDGSERSKSPEIFSRYVTPCSHMSPASAYVSPVPLSNPVSPVLSCNTLSRVVPSHSVSPAPSGKSVNLIRLGSTNQGLVNRDGFGRGLSDHKDMSESSGEESCDSRVIGRGEVVESGWNDLRDAGEKFRGIEENIKMELSDRLMALSREQLSENYSSDSLLSPDRFSSQVERTVFLGGLNLGSGMTRDAMTLSQEHNTRSIDKNCEDLQYNSCDMTLISQDINKKNECVTTETANNLNTEQNVDTNLYAGLRVPQFSTRDLHTMKNAYVSLRPLSYLQAADAAMPILSSPSSCGTAPDPGMPCLFEDVNFMYRAPRESHSGTAPCLDVNPELVMPHLSPAHSLSPEFFSSELMPEAALLPIAPSPNLYGVLSPVRDIGTDCNGSVSPGSPCYSNESNQDETTLMCTQDDGTADDDLLCKESDIKSNTLQANRLSNESNDISIGTNSSSVVVRLPYSNLKRKPRPPPLNLHSTLDSECSNDSNNITCIPANRSAGISVQDNPGPMISRQSSVNTPIRRYAGLFTPVKLSRQISDTASPFSTTPLLRRRSLDGLLMKTPSQHSDKPLYLSSSRHKLKRRLTRENSRASGSSRRSVCNTPRTALRASNRMVYSPISCVSSGESDSEVKVLSLNKRHYSPISSPISPVSCHTRAPCLAPVSLFSDRLDAGTRWVEPSDRIWGERPSRPESTAGQVSEKVCPAATRCGSACDLPLRQDLTLPEETSSYGTSMMDSLNAWMPDIVPFSACDTLGNADLFRNSRFNAAYTSLMFDTSSLSSTLVSDSMGLPIPESLSNSSRTSRHDNNTGVPLLDVRKRHNNKSARTGLAEDSPVNSPLRKVSRLNSATTPNLGHDNLEKMDTVSDPNITNYHSIANVTGLSDINESVQHFLEAQNLAYFGDVYGMGGCNVTMFGAPILGAVPPLLGGVTPLLGGVPSMFGGVPLGAGLSICGQMAPLDSLVVSMSDTVTQGLLDESGLATLADVACKLSDELNSPRVNAAVDKRSEIEECLLSDSQDTEQRSCDSEKNRVSDPATNLSCDESLSNQEPASHSSTNENAASSLNSANHESQLSCDQGLTNQDEGSSCSQLNDNYAVEKYSDCNEELRSIESMDSQNSVTSDLSSEETGEVTRLGGLGSEGGEGQRGVGVDENLGRDTCEYETQSRISDKLSSDEADGEYNGNSSVVPEKRDAGWRDSCAHNVLRESVERKVQETRSPTLKSSSMSVEHVSPDTELSSVIARDSVKVNSSTSHSIINGEVNDSTIHTLSYSYSNPQHSQFSVRDSESSCNSKNSSTSISNKSSQSNRNNSMQAGGRSNTNKCSSSQSKTEDNYLKNLVAQAKRNGSSNSNSQSKLNSSDLDNQSSRLNYSDDLGNQSTMNNSVKLNCQSTINYSVNLSKSQSSLSQSDINYSLYSDTSCSQLEMSNTLNPSESNNSYIKPLINSSQSFSNNSSSNQSRVQRKLSNNEVANDMNNSVKSQQAAVRARNNNSEHSAAYSTSCYNGRQDTSNPRNNTRTEAGYNNSSVTGSQSYNNGRYQATVDLSYLSATSCYDNESLVTDSSCTLSNRSGFNSSRGSFEISDTSLECSGMSHMERSGYKPGSSRSQSNTSRQLSGMSHTQTGYRQDTSRSHTSANRQSEIKETSDWSSDLYTNDDNWSMGGQAQQRRPELNYHRAHENSSRALETGPRVPQNRPRELENRSQMQQNRSQVQQNRSRLQENRSTVQESRSFNHCSDTNRRDLSRANQAQSSRVYKDQYQSSNCDQRNNSTSRHNQSNSNAWSNYRTYPDLNGTAHSDVSHTSLSYPYRIPSGMDVSGYSYESFNNGLMGYAEASMYNNRKSNMGQYRQSNR